MGDLLQEIATLAANKYASATAAMGRVSVYARIRPGADDCLAADGPTTVKMDGREGAQKRTWDFDGVLPPEAPQAAVYDDVGAPILDAVLQGYNGTVFAYG